MLVSKKRHKKLIKEFEDQNKHLIHFKYLLDEFHKTSGIRLTLTNVHTVGRAVGKVLEDSADLDGIPLLTHET